MKKRNKKIPAICKVWADAIENGIRTLEDVPKKYKEIVVKILKDRGIYDEIVERDSEIEEN